MKQSLDVLSNAAVPSSPVPAPVPSRRRDGTPYEGGGRGAAVATLVRHINDLSILLLLNGSAGSGKSAVLDAALAAVAARPGRVTRLGHPDGSPWTLGAMGRQLLAALGRQLLGGSAGAVTDSEIVSVLNLTLGERGTEHPLLIAVDDAQTLTDEALEYLLLRSTTRGQGAPLQILLSGRDTFWNREWRGPLRGVALVTRCVTLQPLAGAEIGDYVAHRLTSFDDTPETITPEAIEEIARHSEGLPARIERILADVTVLRAFRDSRALTGGMVRTTLAAPEPPKAAGKAEGPTPLAAESLPAPRPANGSAAPMPPRERDAWATLATTPALVATPGSEERGPPTALALTKHGSLPAPVPTPAPAKGRVPRRTWPAYAATALILVLAGGLFVSRGGWNGLLPPAPEGKAPDGPPRNGSGPREPAPPRANPVASPPAAPLTESIPPSRPPPSVASPPLAVAPSVPPLSAPPTSARPPFAVAPSAVAPSPSPSVAPPALAVVPSVPPLSAPPTSARAPFAVAPSPSPSVAPSPSLPSAPAVPVSAPMAPEAVAALLRRGDALLQGGDIVAARLLFERAAAAGSGPGATRVGKTYDPAFLATLGVNGPLGDTAQAINWYRKASVEFGDSEAGERLRSLTPRGTP